MKFKRFIVFEADFPDDAVWDEAENLLSPGGKTVLQALVSALGQCGFQTRELYQHDDVGWDAFATAKSCRFELTIQGGGPDSTCPWLFIWRPTRTLIDILLFKNRREQCEAFLKTLETSLRSDPRFKNVQFLTEKEFEQRELELFGSHTEEDTEGDADK